MYAGVASAVAFMGPKRRRPPVFYFSSMMVADAEGLATDSSLSTHPASVAACMAWPLAWESQPQKRETRSQTGCVVRGSSVDGSDDARAPLLVVLAWSSELLNCAPA